MKVLMLIAPLLALLLAGCHTPPKNTLTQVSTIDALLASVYDGQMSCEELLTHGDFGLGTFDQLDGEMIVLDGRIYQAQSTGVIQQPDLSLTTPFAAVVAFEADLSTNALSGASFKQLTEQIDQLAPNQNLFCAVKLHGTFSHLKTRAVPAQTKPYPPLSEVAKQQPEFTFSTISGTIVGFRCPAYVQGINVPGYHLHFLSDDHSKGGHILELTVSEATLELDRCNRFSMILPNGSTAFSQLDLSQDRSTELHQVEQ